MVGGLQVIVLSFDFHQNRLSGFGAVGVEICPFPLTWPLAYTTACTTVQAVMSFIFAETGNVDITTTLAECQGGDGQIASPCQILR